MLELNDSAKKLRSIFVKRQVVKAIIFGSMARNEPSKHSDIDLIIIQNTKKRFLDRYDDFMKEILTALPGMTVDLLVYTPEEIERICHRPMIADALREGKIIYESPG